MIPTKLGESEQISFLYLPSRRPIRVCGGSGKLAVATTPARLTDKNLGGERALASLAYVVGSTGNPVAKFKVGLCFCFCNCLFGTVYARHRLGLSADMSAGFLRADCRQPFPRAYCRTEVPVRCLVPHPEKESSTDSSTTTMKATFLTTFPSAAGLTFCCFGTTTTKGLVPPPPCNSRILVLP